MGIRAYLCPLVVMTVILIAFADSNDLEFPPDFLKDHRCRRNDPEVEKCMMKALEDLKPYLKKGIPELSIPALEPLFIREFALPQQNQMGMQMNASVTNVRAYGASNFKLKFKFGVDNLTSNIVFELPHLIFAFDYNVDMRIPLPVKGYGIITGNLTKISADAILRAKLERQQDGDHIKIDKMDVKLGLGNFFFSLENLYKGSTVLNKDSARFANSNSKRLIKSALPFANRIVSEKLPVYINKITDHFLYDDLFFDDED